LAKRKRKTKGESPEKTIQRFSNFQKAEGKAEGTISQYKGILKDLARFVDNKRTKPIEECTKPFITITRSDLETYIADWVDRDSSKIKGKSYKDKGKAIKKKTSESYMNFIRSVIKYFFKWLYQTDEFPDCVKWIKPKNIRRELDPKEILTEEEIFKLIRAADNKRDRALVHILYESGGRVSEIRNLNVQDVTFESVDGHITAKLNITQGNTKGKQKGKYLRLVDSAQSLMDWLEEHPSPLPNEPLWINTYNNLGGAISLATIRRILDRLARLCKITKPVHPHALRHAQVTSSAKYLSDQQLKQKFGWTAGSRMLQTYTHLTDETIDEQELQMRGLKRVKANSKRILTHIKCEQCGKVYSAGKRICDCGRPLDPDMAKLWDQEKQEKDQALAEFMNVFKDLDLDKIKMITNIMKGE
jgi:site-specific recombinase XerD